MTQYFRNSIFLILACLTIMSCEREPGSGDTGSGEKDYKYFYFRHWEAGQTLCII